MTVGARNGAPGILVVDDQGENRTAIAAVLEPLGRRLVMARSGEEALRRLLDDDFAVVVMDVRMPGLDGLETVELIKQRPRHADTAVVFLTAADADAEQIMRGYETGAVDYILKPVDPDVLRSKVAMLLELQEKSAALRASEERFRAAFEDAPIGMGLTTVEGDWLEVNAALCELLGRSAPQVLTDPPRFEPGEVRLTRDDGRAIRVLVSVSQALDAHGRPLNQIWQFVDVTDQRRAAAEREARTEAEAVADAMGKLQQVTEAALEHLELQELLEQLAERIRDVFGADLVRVLLLDDDEERVMRVGATTGFNAEPTAEVPFTGVLERVLQERRTVTVADLPDGAGIDAALAAENPHALMAAPLTVGNRVAGVVEVGVRSVRRFDAGEEGLLMLMADRAGLAVEHARAYERELSNVELLQRSLLPDRLPYVEGMRIAARYRPGGADVGGDWYDAIPLEGGRLGVAMGDVVGHGLQAASLMGQLRHATRAYALEGHSPALVLDRLDRLVRSLDGGQMATLVYLVVEPGVGSIRFASAGHVPPLAVSPGGKAHFLPGAPNPPLGVFASEPHVELTAELDPGSTLVLYTDGLVEERGASIDAGLETLRAAAAGGAAMDPDDLCDRLLDAQAAGRHATDDVAVLVLRPLSAPLLPLHLEVPADPTLLGSVRRDLARWLRAAGAEGEAVEAMQIACHEACSNAIEHAYAFGDGSFTIDARLDSGSASVTVTDRGGWVERPNGNLPNRGHGLPLINALMDSVELRRDGEGTSVAMTRRLASA